MAAVITNMAGKVTVILKLNTKQSNLVCKKLNFEVLYMSFVGNGQKVQGLKFKVNLFVIL